MSWFCILCLVSSAKKYMSCFLIIVLYVQSYIHSIWIYIKFNFSNNLIYVSKVSYSIVYPLYTMFCILHIAIQNISVANNISYFFVSIQRFRRGVFQGDPYSPIIFLICFNPLIQYLKKFEEKYGYEMTVKDENNTIYY